MARVKMQDRPDQLNTFEGALAPTLLALLGVLPALAIPAAVAAAGPLGTAVAILLGAGLAGCTGLALAAVISDAPAGPAPSHAPLTRSLGAELGGTLSLPLLFARPATAAVAVIGARMIWRAAWPHHPQVMVDLLLLGAMSLLAWLGPSGLRKAQAPLLALLALSLGMILAGLLPAGQRPAPLLGEGGSMGLWLALSWLFPAVAGLLAGANIPGVLADPRRSLPRGTFWAIAVAAGVNLLLALAVARSVPAALLTEPAVLIYRAPFPSLVAAGLLLTALWVGASALAGGARLLAELARGGLLDDRIDQALRRPQAALPWVIAVSALMLALTGELALAAALLTALLLLCWGALNGAVLALTVLGLPSFRPSWRVPRWVLVVGALGCVVSLMLIAPGLGMLGLAVLVARYLAMERQPRGPRQRSGLLLALAEWGAARVHRFGATSPRAWRPHLLVPVWSEGLGEDERAFLIRATTPEGSLRLLGLQPPGADPAALRALQSDLSTDDLIPSLTLVETTDPIEGALTSLHALQGTFLRPNLIYQALGPPESDPRTIRMVQTARAAGMGVLLFAPAPQSTARRNVSVWVRPHAEAWDPAAAFALGHLDLTLLMAIRLQRREDLRINLITAVGSEEELARAHTFLDGLALLGRLPPNATRTVAVVGSLPEVLTRTPPADLHIFGMPPDTDPELARRIQKIAGVGVLFVAGSGTASVR